MKSSQIARTAFTKLGLPGNRLFFALLAYWTFLACGCGTPTSEAPGAAIRVTMEEMGAEADAETSSADTGEPEAREPGGGPVRLTLSEAIRHALVGNRDIQVASYDPPQTVQTLRSAEAVYDPSFFSAGTLSGTERPVQSQLDTGSALDDIFTEDRWLLQVGLKKHLPTGGDISVFQESEHLKSNSELIAPNPQDRSRMKMELTQPVLRGAFDLPHQSAMEIAKQNIAISNQEFRQLVTGVVSETAKTYWQLVSERDFVRIAKETLDMAREILRREEARLEKGISDPLDVNRARMTVTTREMAFLSDQKRVRDTSEQLKSLLNLFSAPPGSEAEVIPLDRPPLEAVSVEKDDAVGRALENRPELIRARMAEKVSRLQMDIADHHRLPRLDAKLSYTMNGLGDDIYKAAEMSYTEDKSSWVVGLEFEWPIKGRQADAEYLKRTLAHRQSLAEIRRVTEQITHEVAQATYAVRLAKKEVEITRQAKLAAQSVVLSEKARFELAPMDNAAILRLQDLFASAARDHIRAIMAYEKSLIMLRHVQGTLLDDLGIRISEQAEKRKG